MVIGSYSRRCVGLNFFFLLRVVCYCQNKFVFEGSEVDLKQKAGPFLKLVMDIYTLINQNESRSTKIKLALLLFMVSPSE